MVNKLEELEIINQETISENIKAKKVANYGYDLPNTQWRRLGVSSKGALLTNGLVPEEFDYLSLAQDTLTDVWTYKIGGSSGTTVATVTITYTSSGKTVISNIART